MIKICPHCGKEFECKTNDIMNCHCVHINLSAETRAHIASLYHDCLCENCLKLFQNKFQKNL
ncbi:MAG: cysteine-rich CWC family protein [Bacteroidales bacterium]